MKRNILFTLTFVLFCFQSFSQDSISLNKSNLDIKDNDDYSSFSIFNSIPDSTKVVFLGENHLYRNINDDINLKFIKYLNKTFGFNTIALEFGFTRGYMVNEYIHTGDSLIIETLKKNTGFSFIDLYEKLYKYNLTLPDSLKINVIGVDVERYMGLPVNKLCSLLPDDFAPDEISMNVEALRSLNNNDDLDFDYDFGSRRLSLFDLERSLEIFIEDYEKKATVYKEWIGEKFQLFDTIVETLRGYIQWRKYSVEGATQSFVFREENLEKGIAEYLKTNPGAKIYAQFGRCHVAVITQEEACSWKNYNSVAARLNNKKNPETAGKICSIGMFYTKSLNIDEIPRNNPASKYFIENSEKNGVTAFEVPDTIELLSEFSEKFDFIIFNDYSTLRSVNKKSSKSPAIGFLNIGYTQGLFDFSKLNKINPFGNISNNLDVLRFEFGGRENQSMFFKGAVQISIPQEFNYNDSLKIKFNCNTFMFYTGIDLTKSKVFDIIPQYGYGFGRLKIAGVKTTNNPDPIFNPMSDSTTFKYTNPALLLDLALELRINIKYVSIGGIAGLLLDVSNKQWWTNGYHIKNSPSTSFRNYYFGAFISWIFTE